MKVFILLTLFGIVYNERLANSSLFDSINRDLDEIKAAISKTLKSPRFNTSSYVFKTDTSDYSDTKVAAHYLEDLEADRLEVDCSEPTNHENLWKFSVPYLNDSLGILRFREFRNKPVLLVNVATFCESTKEYPLYNDLKDKYGDNLVIVGFPSNQFLNVIIL